jgi:hypothetical protein
VQRGPGLGQLAEREQTPALSQQRLGLFPWHLKVLPAGGGVGEQGGCFGVLAVALGEQGVGGDRRVLLQGVPGLERAGQPGR